MREISLRFSGGIRETSSDVRVAVTRSREYEPARTGEPGRVPRESRRATLVPVYTDYQSKTRYLMRPFPEKPQRNEEQHGDNEDCEGEWHTWDETVGYSAPLSPANALSRVT